MGYLLNRIALLILTLLFISIVTFAITNLLPGNVAMMILSFRGTPETIAALEQKLGLNDPLILQYWHWISGMVQGDWGTSLRFKEPIGMLVSQKMLASSVIIVLSLVIALVFAIPLGVISAIKHNRWQDTLSSGMALTGISLPDFFWGIVFILLFSRGLGWLPSSGYVSPADNFFLSLKYALLPAITLGIGLVAQLAA